MIKEKLCQGSSSNITIPDAVQANNQKHNFSINKVKSVAFIRSARISYCTFGASPRQKILLLLGLGGHDRVDMDMVDKVDMVDNDMDIKYFLHMSLIPASPLSKSRTFLAQFNLK